MSVSLNDLPRSYEAPVAEPILFTNREIETAKYLRKRSRELRAACITLQLRNYEVMTRADELATRVSELEARQLVSSTPQLAHE